jgi:P pilus assembly chaperone PapD
MGLLKKGYFSTGPYLFKFLISFISNANLKDMAKYIRFSILILVGFSLKTFAFEFLPSVANYDFEGPGASQKYSVHNANAEPVSIEISAQNREIDELGIETRSPTNDFNLYPKLFILKPGETRTVKATYVGEKNLKFEKAYRIVAEQLSVEPKKKQESTGTTIGINFLMKYETSAYVSQRGAKAKVEVINISSVQDPKKGRLLSLKLQNTGEAHQFYQKWVLNINRLNAPPLKLDKTKNKDWPEFNLLAGHTIKIEIPWPTELESLPESVTILSESL